MPFGEGGFILFCMVKNKPQFKDVLGKRDVVKNMIQQQMLLSEICKAIGATREELDDFYGDLLELHRPLEYIPTEEDRLLVWRSAAYGMTQKEIAYRLGISSTCLADHFRRELDAAKTEWIDQVATTLVSQAKEGSVQAGIFLLKARAGWKETQINELTGKDGAPIAHKLDMSKWTDEELTIAEQLATKATVPIGDTAGKE